MAISMGGRNIRRSYRCDIFFYAAFQLLSDLMRINSCSLEDRKNLSEGSSRLERS